MFYLYKNMSTKHLLNMLEYPGEFGIDVFDEEIIFFVLENRGVTV